MSYELIYGCEQNCTDRHNTATTKLCYSFDIELCYSFDIEVKSQGHHDLRSNINEMAVFQDVIAIWR